MRILFVIANLEGGGAQRAILNVAKGLAARGHEAHVALLEHRIDYPVPDTIEVHAIRAPGERLVGGWFGKWRAAAKLRRLHRKLTKDAPFDITLSSLPFTDEVVKRAGLPRVWFRIANNLSAEIAALGNPRRAARRRARYRRIYDGERLIAVSKGVADDLREGLGLRRADIVTIYNPFDFGEIRAQADVPEPDLPAEPYLVHAGRFQRQKRHDVLLDAFKASGLPHRLVLLTAPSPELSALIASCGLEARVTVAGFRNNPFPWYAKAEAMVLSSDREGMPNVLVEALACGTPVVSTDCPSGPAEVLTGEMRRWLVPCGDAAQLAARMREVVELKPAIESSLLARFSKDAALDAVEALANR